MDIICNVVISFHSPTHGLEMCVCSRVGLCINSWSSEDIGGLWEALKGDGGGGGGGGLMKSLCNLCFVVIVAKRSWGHPAFIMQLCTDKYRT